MIRSTRRAGHTAANAAVVGYLLAAAVLVFADLPGAAPTWLLVHLLLLGAATNAIVTWTAHFASTLLQQPQLPAVLIGARVVALNLAVVGVLTGVQEGWTALVVAAAVLLAMVLAAHLGLLVQTVHAGRTRRFAPAVRFYWAAAAAVLLGISAGTAMVVGVPSTWWERTYVVHVQLNLLGWVTLAVLGTQFTLWPTALRTRMVEGTEQTARRCLVATSAGLTAAVTGVLADVRALAVVGLVLYLVGVLDFVVPFLRTGLQRAPRSPATLMLAGSTAWLVAGIVVDVVAVIDARGSFGLADRVGEIVPWFLAGFVVQVLLGALSYLVPVVLGGRPAVGKRTAAALNTLAVPRVVMLNVGVLCVALGGSDLARAGWALVAVAIATFVGLAVLAAARSRASSATV